MPGADFVIGRGTLTEHKRAQQQRAARVDEREQRETKSEKFGGPVQTFSRTAPGLWRPPESRARADAFRCSALPGNLFQVRDQGMHSHFDGALVVHFAQLSRAGVRLKDFIDMIAGISFLVWTCRDVEDVMKEEELKNVSAQLRRLCSESELGKRVFGAKLSGLAMAEFLSSIDKIIAESFKNVAITEEIIAQVMAMCADEAGKWQLDSRCVGRQEIDFFYFRISLLITCSNSTELILLKVNCYIKERGVELGLLSQMWFETAILGDQKKYGPGVDPEHLKPMQAARRMCNDEATAAMPASGDLAVAMMGKSLPTLLQVDASFNIEFQLAKSLASGPGAAKLHTAMMEMLPSKTVWKSLRSSIAALEVLSTSALMICCARPAQARVSQVLATLRHMDRGYGPVFTNWGGCAKLLEVQESMELFFKYEVGAGFADEMYGRKALVRYFTDIKNRFEENEIVLLQDMQSFAVFDWLLSEELRKEAVVMIEMVFKKTSHMPIDADFEPKKHRKRTIRSSSANITAAPNLAEDDDITNLFA